MWINLFLCLLLAHLIGDFVPQTSKSCKYKRDKKWGSVYHYCHAVIVFALAWLASWDWAFCWCALAIGVTHFAIDMWKSYCKDNVIWFTVDQLLHVAVMAGAAWMWCSMNDWSMPFDIPVKYVALAIAILICWKPANIFIKLMLKSEIGSLLLEMC